MSLELLVFGESAALPPGVRGRILPDASSALAAAEASESEVALLLSADLLPSLDSLLQADLSRDDLLHAGPQMGARGAFYTLQLASQAWFFLDPDPGGSCVSWKALPELCFLRPPQIRALGGFDRGYVSPIAQLMDFAYRLLRAGGRVRSSAALHAGREAPPPSIPLQDELLFLLRHVNLRGAAYAAAWQAILERAPVSALRALRAARRRARAIAAPEAQGAPLELRLLSSAPVQRVRSISAIIPTLCRYAYVGDAIESLLQSKLPPDEVIVVDQTPAPQRRPEVYAPFEDRPVRVIYLDQAGQSSSRNRAIQEAAGEWCLLFDDDRKAWPEMICELARTVELSGADAATGASLAPWKTVNDIPEELRRPFLADVLDTGCSLVRREALLAVGGLDHAFERGSGADHDLGVRLYLEGRETIFNAGAISTHYKARSGGLRAHGAWWRNQTTLLGPYPPPTQVYTIRRYYPRAYWPALYLQLFLRAQGSRWETAFVWLAGPWKLHRALQAARRLKTKFGLHGAGDAT